jgi:antitoxin (DNA-binding transcriptional repressor) of toxin-antitoxin stability system
MQSVNIQQLRDDVAGVISAAQQGDVAVTDQGRIVAMVTKPRSNPDFESYWQWRERMLADVVAAPGWDSTQAVSDDRDGI